MVMAPPRPSPSPSDFDTFLRGGSREGLQRATFTEREARTLSSVVMTGGAFLVTPQFQNRVEQALDASSALVAASTPVRGRSGANLLVPMVDDRTEGELVVEGAAASEGDLLFAAANVPTFLYTSKILKVPFALVQDAGVDLESFLADILARRIGRVFGRHAVTGTGGNSPAGLTITAPVGVAATSNALISWDSVLRLEASVGDVHRFSEGAAFVMSGSSYSALQRQTDGNGRPMIDSTNGVRRMDGYPVVIEPSMPSIGPSTRPLIFGNLRRHLVREAEVTLVVNSELFAANMQIGYQAVMRLGCSLIDPGDQPVSVLEMAA